VPPDPPYIIGVEMGQGLVTAVPQNFWESKLFRWKEGHYKIHIQPPMR